MRGSEERWRRGRCESTDAIAPAHLWLMHTAENRWFLTQTHHSKHAHLHTQEHSHTLDYTPLHYIGLSLVCLVSVLLIPASLWLSDFTLGSLCSGYCWLTLSPNRWALVDPATQRDANELFLYFYPYGLSVYSCLHITQMCLVKLR